MTPTPDMSTSTPSEVLARLDRHSAELRQLSDSLLKINQRLDRENIEKRYQEFVDNYETGLWLKCQEKDGPKWPSEALREKLARLEMPAELLGQRDGLRMQRDRIKQRIADLKVIVEADRSILSAQKEGLV